MRKVRMQGFCLLMLASAATICVTSGCENRNKGSHGSQNDSYSISFPKSEEKSWEVMRSKDIIPYPLGLHLQDSVLVISGRLDGKWIHHYDKETGKLHGSYLQMGRGNGEVVEAENISFGNDGSIEVFDISQNKIINLDKDFSEVKSWQTSDIAPNIQGTWRLADGHLLCKYLQSDGKDITRCFVLVDSNEHPKIISKQTTIGKDLNVNSLIFTQQSVMAIAPDGRNFATGTKAGAILEFFTISDDKIEPKNKEIYFEPEFIEDNGNVHTPDFPVIGFSSMVANDKYLIASYGGTNIDDEVNNIGVWDWDGNPIKMVKTNASIFALAYDQDSEMLYSVIMPKNSELMLAKMKFDIK